MIRTLYNLISNYKFSYCVIITGFFLNACEEDQVSIQPTLVQTSTASVLQDEFQNEKFVVYNNLQFDILVAYDRELNGNILDFHPSDSLPAILEDNLGNHWNVFGESISGPNRGARLNFLHQVKAYWFSIAAFYAEVSLYSEGVEKELLETEQKDGWLIDTDFIVQAAAPNAIPAIYNPDFKEIGTKEMFIDGNHKQSDLILAVRINGEERIYPERVLEYHEIVNDVIQSTNVTISFCPLTGTGYCWDRQDRNYYVSGLLHNANLILNDWETNSQWSQIYGKSVFGPDKETEIDQIPIIEMNWEGRTLLNTNKSLYTGQDLPAGGPYESYKTSNSIGFPVSFTDSRLLAKEKVLAVIINGKAKVYRANDF
ncbi:MAG: DUF3179 domain-containing protein [Bacteroidetes bacterium]|nr:MAG: DUF3179 domain-containing protein [Bacteroidota bacterium]